MSATSSGGDSQMVKSVVDRLKKQGLFDRFRKECLADVDTKPAYQNLQHRVEGAVGRFLSTQTWSRNLSKNQLRDSLRKHLTESQILSSGVDRVIEQVVHPKIQINFKPEIDRAICEYMGMDYEQWLNKKKLREELIERQSRLVEAEDEKKEWRGKDADISAPPNNMLLGYPNAVGQPMMFPGSDGQHFPPGFHGNIPSLLDLPLASSASNMPISSSTSTNFPQMPPQFGGMSQALTQTTGQFSSFNMGNSGFFPPGIFPPTNIPPPPLNFSAVPAPILPGIENPPPAVPGGGPSADYILELVQKRLESAASVPLPESPLKTEKPKKKVPIEPLTVESLLNIPLPKTESPKFADVAKYDPQQGVMMESEVCEKIEESVVVEETIIEDSEQVHMPHEPVNLGASDEVEPISTEDEDWKPQQDDTSQASSIAVASSNEQPKVYQFAWDNVDIDNLSDVTVSSVHTSDVSSYCESDNDDLEDLEEEEREEEDVPQEEDKDEVEEGSIVHKGVPTETGAVEVVAAVPVQTEKSKPRKLISLSYNYSDSDNDETREERKARIAREKEERYLKRQQRRAELEAKRKEREEERLRNRQAKPITAAKMSTKTDTNEDDKAAKLNPAGLTSSLERNAESGIDSSQQIDTSLLSPCSSPIKSPLGSSLDSPTKLNRSRSRKTKAQLKEELREQKVLEKCMALRRQRTRNKKYFSEDFESIYTEKKGLLVGDLVMHEQEVIVEESQEFEIVEQDNPPTPPTPTQDENVELQTAIVLGSHESNEGSEVRNASRPPSPYSELSDISDISKSWESESETNSAGKGKGEEHVRRRSRSPMYRRSRSRSLSKSLSRSRSRRRRHRNSCSSSSSDRSRGRSSQRRERYRRSGSQSRRKSRSPSRSSSSSSRGRSRGHSHSSSPSRRHSQSRSKSRSTSRSKSCNRSQSGDASHRGSDDGERSKNYRRSITQVSFGEAARRSAKRWIETVDFGEAGRRASGQAVPPAWNAPRGQMGFPARGGPSGGTRRPPPPHGTLSPRGATSPRGRNLPGFSSRGSVDTSFGSLPGQGTAEHSRSSSLSGWQKPSSIHEDSRSYSPASQSQEEDGDMHDVHSSQSRDSESSSPLSSQKFARSRPKQSRSLSPGERPDTDEEMEAIARADQDVHSPKHSSSRLSRSCDWSPSEDAASPDDVDGGPSGLPPPGRRLIPPRGDTSAGQWHAADADKPMTRAGRRRSEQENAPIAKRLRR